MTKMTYYPFRLLVDKRLAHLFHCEGDLHRLWVNSLYHLWMCLSILQHSEHYCLHGPQHLDQHYEEVKIQENLYHWRSDSTIYVNLKRQKQVNRKMNLLQFSRKYPTKPKYPCQIARMLWAAWHITKGEKLNSCFQYQIKSSISTTIFSSKILFTIIFNAKQLSDYQTKN